jgi:DNA-binding NtrC family response regulator
MPTVLIVEDEGPLLLLAECMLQTAGYETICASTVAQALAIIENADGQLDLLFTDLGLRDQLDGGLDVGQAAAGAYPGLPVLYTTGRAVTDGLVTRFVEPHKLIAKPYIEEHLLAAVTDLLQQKSAWKTG